jgi:hypothetical protein
METYAYLGAGQLATAMRDAAQSWGLTVARDEFSRVSSMRWQTSDGNTRLDYQTYQYDEVGNLKDKFIQTASGNWFEHFEYNGLNQPTEHASRFYSGNLAISETFKWNQDSLGNRVDTGQAGDQVKYGTPTQQQAISSNQKTGDLKTVVLNSNRLAHPYYAEDKAKITYDAWGRARKIHFEIAVDETITGDYVLTYDALNRLAWRDYSATKKTYQSTTQESQQDIYSYAGNLELRHRVKPGGENESTFSESLWSPDGRMVGRADTSQFIWTTTDIQGRTTTLIENGTLNVLERFVYDVDGMVKGTNASFALLEHTLGEFSWTQFAAGKQWINILERSNKALLGFYLSSSNGLYDPQNNSVVTNNPVFTNNVPASTYEYVSSGWMTTSKVFATIGTTALAIATGGVSLAVQLFIAGAGIGYADARLGGASPEEALDAAWSGGIYAQGFVATLAILPAAATPYVLAGATVYGGYTAYDSFSQGHYAQGTFRALLAGAGGSATMRSAGYRFTFQWNLTLPRSVTTYSNPLRLPFKIGIVKDPIGAAKTQAMIRQNMYDEIEYLTQELDATIPERFLNPKNRPDYAVGQIEQVWQNALREGNGKVLDPHTGEIILWNRTQPRNGQWDMGHIQSYSSQHARLLNGEMTWAEFLNWYHDPASYHPQSIPSNRGHLGEI